MLHKFGLKSFFTTLLFSGIIFYFCYHMISGGRGILAYFKLNSQMLALESELEITRAERLTIEHKSNLLKSNSLDLDLLEEQAKRVLGYAKPKEILVIEDSEPLQ